ncbi:MAG: hypothetical protein QF511_07925 [Rhodospirillales bacterium]|jgi:hypothetical protein|nr:hypothetical protein [Rhodospirillales bacterium]HIJ42903.1 hypothetical protein [Rhodospirillaceae bacterium]MDP7214588.1 hypothetical protein [Rhodospirillales bacterium]HIJ44846.1 hypothetical protein [Rhodospirillaceae bacterium]HIJ93299.1 hypothetical protein [Rhodospirillaceae bacterium]
MKGLPIILAALVAIAFILVIWVFAGIVKTHAATATNPRKLKAEEEPSPPAEKAAAGKKPESSDRDFAPSQF